MSAPAKQPGRAVTTTPVAELSADEKRLLLARMLREKSARSQHFPLSFSQQPLWFLNQLEGASSAYNVPTFFVLRGAVDEGMLANGLREIVRRHEILRVRFELGEDQPFQVIGPEMGWVLSVIDIAGLDERARRSEVDRLLHRYSETAFDLEHGPVFCFALLRLAATESILVLVIHHIVTDGWSMGILLRELTALYQAFAGGEPSPLAELPIQYVDYAVWQRRWFEGETLAEHLAFWREQLGSGSPVLELPTDRPRPAVQSYRGRIYPLLLSTDLRDELRDLGRQRGATLFMTLLAALKVLLHRTSGQTDLSVGVPIANRTRPQVEPLIGYFVNTLVLRTDLTTIGTPAGRSVAELTFGELLQRAREVTLGAYDHQDLPFEKLVDELQVERSVSHSPLFQVMFILLNTAPLTEIEVAGLTFSAPELESGAARFDLTLELVDEREWMAGSIQYNRDLFDRTTIARLVGHFQRLLSGIATDPDRPLGELPWMSRVERHQLLREWNDTMVAQEARQVLTERNLEASALPAEQCIHQLFEAWARTDPGAEALRCGERVLTCRELNEQANRLAHLLRRRGVGPEVVVGIYLSRSVEMMVALLGILKAGGGYLPLDPDWPSDRLRYLLVDAGAAELLTRERQLPSLPLEELAELGVRPLVLERATAALAAESPRDPEPLTRSDNLAYIIYTSGSTGQPKGVAVSHRSLLHHTYDAAAAYGLGAGDRVLQFSSLAFDASAEEIFPCWVGGTGLVLRTEAMLASVSEFLDACRQEGITVLNLPTAYWHEVADADVGALPAQLRVVIIGGEKARVDRLQRWRRWTDPFPRLFNTYGPTEATVVATRCELVPEIRADVEVPIGRALDYARVYILDRELVSMPVGVVGELHIAGAGLARGYLRRGVPTAERFIPDLFAETPGERLYKSGDQARWRPDGWLECLGRFDFQIKIRGYRIEPGEIEALLRRHPAVNEAVVATRREEGWEWDRLVAWVAAEPAPAAGELRAYLRERLPEYMVPTVFLSLPELPKTTAGKVDRRALPAPDRSRPEIEHRYVAPRTPSEEVLVEMVSELLSVEKVGVDDSFFDLGGHSLLATQFRSRIRSFFEIEVPLQAIFENPTVARLGVMVERLILDELEAERDDP